MNTIDTTLTASGNSTALRLPKELLRMSGFNSNSRVRLKAGKGEIVISNSIKPREGWSAQIKSLVKSGNDPSLEFSDMKNVFNDGLDNLPWEGPSFEEWQKSGD